jgi:hypothetical protein
MQDHAPHQLDIIMPLAQDPFSCFSYHSESLGQKIIQGFSLFQPLPELNGFSAQFSIGKLLHLRFQLVNTFYLFRIFFYIPGIVIEQILKKTHGGPPFTTCYPGLF